MLPCVQGQLQLQAATYANFVCARTNLTQKILIELECADKFVHFQDNSPKNSYGHTDWKLISNKISRFEWPIPGIHCNQTGDVESDICMSSPHWLQGTMLNTGIRQVIINICWVPGGTCKGHPTGSMWRVWYMLQVEWQQAIQHKWYVPYNKGILPTMCMHVHAVLLQTITNSCWTRVWATTHAKEAVLDLSNNGAMNNVNTKWDVSNLMHQVVFGQTALECWCFYSAYPSDNCDRVSSSSGLGKWSITSTSGSGGSSARCPNQ